MAQAAALILLVFGLLPIANWIPGGHAAPWYDNRLHEWLINGGIVLGIGAIAAIGLRSRPALWRPGLWGGVAARWRAGGRAADAGFAAIVFALCAAVSRWVLSGKPLLIDEVISLFQARTFASGRIWLPAPRWTEFTSAMHLLDWNGKVYGQFPAGGPALLAIRDAASIPRAGRASGHGDLAHGSSPGCSGGLDLRDGASRSRHFSSTGSRRSRSFSAAR